MLIMVVLPEIFCKKEQAMASKVIEEGYAPMVF